MNHDEIIDFCRRIVSSQTHDSDHQQNKRIYLPPVTDKQVAQAEQKLGIRFPPLLVRIYTEVCNGGLFGIWGVPDTELSQNADNISAGIQKYKQVRNDLYVYFLSTPLDVVSTNAYDERTLCEIETGFFAYRDPDTDLPENIWPFGFIQIRDLGCGITENIYCLSEDFPVVLHDPNSEYRSPAKAEEVILKGSERVTGQLRVVSYSFDDWVERQLRNR